MRYPFLLPLLCLGIFAGPSLSLAQVAEDVSSPSVYAYFNVSNSDEDSTLSPDQFKEQVNEIGIGNYTVLSVEEMLTKEQKAESFSPNSIVITFDDPDNDTYASAIPLLQEHKIPFTIFISPGNTDDAEWDLLKSLQKSPLATIGLTSFNYGHNGSMSVEKLQEDINKAKSIYREKLGTEPLYFAYPFGEYTKDFVEAVRNTGFKAAFGQNSGVITAAHDRMKLPRFTMTDDYGDIERFRTTASAMPFPVKELQPDYSYVISLPVIGFTVDDRISNEDVKKTVCFASGNEQPELHVLESRRVELRFKETPDTDRLRINCTIAVAGEFEDDDPRYRWLGFLLYFPVKQTAVPENFTDVSPEQP